jgi:hypothetical protein
VTGEKEVLFYYTKEAPMNCTICQFYTTCSDQPVQGDCLNEVGDEDVPPPP